MKPNIKWLMPVLICLLASILSVFMPVLTYVYPNGNTVGFNILDFTKPSQELIDILWTYQGPMGMDVDDVWMVILAVLAVLAIIAAFAGVITMSRQRPNTWQFVLALVGIIGTAVPAILIMIAVLFSQQYFPGVFRFGIYPIITPVAMVMCMITVTQKHRRTQAEKLAEEKAKGLIRPAGDL